MITVSIPIEAFMGGVGVGISVIFIALLLTLGLDMIRGLVDDNT